MFDWMMAGGWVMGLLLVLGGFAVHTGFDFARRPELGKLPRVEALSRCVGWCTATGVAANLAAVGANVPARPEGAHSPDLPLLLLAGLAESLSPLVLGGAILAVVALLTAAGHAQLRNCA